MICFFLVFFFFFFFQAEDGIRDAQESRGLGDVYKRQHLEHILEIWLYNENAHLKGLTFGFVHCSIMLLGYYSGWSINRLFKIISNGYIAGIIGAALSHICLLYTSDAADEEDSVDLGGRRIIKKKKKEKKDGFSIWQPLKL